MKANASYVAHSQTLKFAYVMQILSTLLYLKNQFLCVIYV